ncbi:hypothetical protein MFLAVUS_008461 [Mucor flavus]|uniref:Uncharacterized protein n=1 Tax=Mucor flavus TaxID=439312 RepID=A0ABP9Z787_9FUNG
MQWRSLILLFSGLVVIYIAILSQDTPYLHPKIIYTSNHPVLTKNPDQLILTTVGPYIYLTSIDFESPTNEPVVGIHNLKLGVQGIVKQFRKPISNLLSERELLETDGWVLCFEHKLRGHVSKVSVRAGEGLENTWQFAVLHHQVDNDSSYHFVRLYYTVDNDSFEYKDIKLPGSIWVNAISLEKESLIFSRDPDLYQFHVMTLPTYLIDAPHSADSKDVVLDSVEPGRVIQEWSQPPSTEQFSMMFSRLYSPVHETYRVFTLSVHKTVSTFFVNITIADNATIINSENKPVRTWLERDRGDSEYPVINNEDLIDYGGFADISSYRNPMDYRQNMPELYLTVSQDLKTIVFPYIKNRFITLDFTNRIDILKKIESEQNRLYTSDKKNVLQEYYYWQPYKTVDSEIMGLQLNNNGSVLALWTEFNRVYIYKRGTEKVEKSLLGKIDRWLDYILSDISDEERDLRRDYFPPSWELEMVITPIRNEYGGSRTVGTVQFWQNENDDQCIFVGYKNGFVNSYRLDRHEPERSVNFWTFALEKWDMLFAMCMVISIFVLNLA